MLFRSATDADTDRVAAVVVDEPVGWIPADRYLDELRQRMYRPEWTWLAEDEGRVVGRALWWGQSTAEHPVDLDCLWVDASVPDRAKVAAGLLAAGLESFTARGAADLPILTVKLTDGWRDDPAVSAAAEWRHDGALAAGLSHVVERLQLEWTPDAALPAAGTRLTFAAATDEEFLPVFRGIAEGSLDASTRKDIAEVGADAAARKAMDFYLDCLGERDWWRLAYDADGAVVGLAIPSATPYARNVGYIGVLPEFRGRGYVDEVLAEITRFQAAAGAERITATTDQGNVPMAAAFARAGFRVTEIRMVYSVPSAS
ncbi:GNAT family N-acetyltransferase [Streptomyces sp. YC504]|uniref:GNAT family N-acetyltransferase n=1 Tax=Streptomyces mesophilus TaxID=1775132 RepID=A0A6G4XCS1_9ACTN|nr:GNAT family N-acetyltransferase [Streptomyces mesophilus]NGO74637.1 GNAT family N-acetyltransferase [Streptomyces mesophilus]